MHEKHECWSKRNREKRNGKGKSKRSEKKKIEIKKRRKKRKGEKDERNEKKRRIEKRRKRRYPGNGIHDERGLNARHYAANAYQPPPLFEISLEKEYRKQGERNHPFARSPSCFIVLFFKRLSSCGVSRASQPRFSIFLSIRETYGNLIRSSCSMYQRNIKLFRWFKIPSGDWEYFHDICNKLRYLCKMK